MTTRLLRGRPRVPSRVGLGAVLAGGSQAGREGRRMLRATQEEKSEEGNNWRRVPDGKQNRRKKQGERTQGEPSEIVFFLVEDTIEILNENLLHCF